MRGLVGTITATAVLVALVSASAAAQTAAMPQVAERMADFIVLPCTVGGSESTHWLGVRNSRSLKIPKGTRLRAEYEHYLGSVMGSVLHTSQSLVHVLVQDLLPGQSTQIAVEIPMQGYPCKAQFDRGRPDLQVLSATLARGKVRLVVKNNGFGAAGAFTARVRLMKCSQIQLGEVDVAVPGVGPEQEIAVFKTVTVPPGYQYLDAAVDVANVIQELSESNNSFTGVGVCIH